MRVQGVDRHADLGRLTISRRHQRGNGHGWQRPVGQHAYELSSRERGGHFWRHVKRQTHARQREIPNRHLVVAQHTRRHVHAMLPPPGSGHHIGPVMPSRKGQEIMPGKIQRRRRRSSMKQVPWRRATAPGASRPGRRITRREVFGVLGAAGAALAVGCGIKTPTITAAGGATTATGAGTSRPLRDLTPRDRGTVPIAGRSDSKRHSRGPKRYARGPEPDGRQRQQRLQSELASVSGNPTAGYTATFTVGISV